MTNGFEPLIKRLGVFCLLLSALLVGCAAPQTDRLLAKPPAAFPAKVVLLEVPFYPQEAYYCGPASLAMTLNWAGVPVSTEELVPRVFTPGRKGTLQTAIVTASRRNGRIAYPVSNLEDLLKELTAGHPVVILQNLGFFWYPRWHFAVAIGYDLPRGEIILHSGLKSRKRLPLDLFERTWARGKYWARVVLPPARLPATAMEGRFLRSALGLERARQFASAARAYEAALVRWPESFGAMMGLGNSRYRAGDLAGAVKAFQEAARARPRSGSAYNNLAHVLAEKGRRRKALHAARKAVAIGGPLKNVFMKTLEEIEKRSTSEP
jgi:hypothetical protein